MRGVEEPLLPERRAVEGGATQSEGAFETQEARYPRLHQTAGLRSLDVWVEISKAPWSVRRGTVGLSSVRIDAICRAFPIPLSPSDPQGAVLRLQLPSRRLCRTVE